MVRRSVQRSVRHYLCVKSYPNDLNFGGDVPQGVVKLQ